MNETKYMNSYLAGVLLGLLLLATIYITGRGLGASGAIKSLAIATVESVAPEHTENATFYKEYSASHGSGKILNLKKVHVQQQKYVLLVHCPAVYYLDLVLNLAEVVLVVLLLAGWQLCQRVV